MLKSARASYNSFDTEEFDYDNWSDSDMRPEMCAILKMTDEELPIKGSVVDWLQLIDKVQKERGARVLTRAQRNTMESFCIEANKQVEMYAFDIYKLLELVWSTKPANGQNAQKIQEAPSPPPQKLAASSSSNLLDSRQRSSKPLNHAPIKPKSSLKRIDHNEYDDGDGAASGSEGHPSISSASTNSITDNIKYEDRTNWRSRPSSLSRKRSQLSSLPPRPYPVVNRRLSFRDPIETVRFRSDEDEIEEEEIDKVRPSPSLSETNTRESVSQRRLREAERRLDIATKEYTDRIIQLETDLSKMKQEISAHKKTIAEHKVQEQYRLAQITELEKRIEEDNRKQNNQKHMCDDLKEQIAVKNDELSRLQSLLDESQESLKLAEIRFDQLQQELRSHERDRHRVAELQARLQEELRTTEDVRRQLEEQQAENEELKNIVDSIKFDLDEARIERAQEERTVMTLRAEIAAANEKRNEEFEAQLPPKLQEALKAIEMLEKVEEERDDYKNQALEALKEVDRARHKKKLLEEENERLRNDIQEFRALRQRQMKLLTMDEFTQTVAREAAESAVQCDMQATAECTKCVDQRAVSSFLKHNLEEQGKILDKLNKEIDNDELNAYALSDYMRLLLGKTWASFLYRIILLLVVLAVISNLFYIMDEFLKPEPISIGIEDVPLESLYPYYNLARRPKSRFMDGLLYWLEQKLYDPDEFIPLT